MIAHVLLFRPSPALAEGERDALVTAFERALSEIPAIQRASIGLRRLMGRRYEAGMPDYPYMATLEFASAEDLREYLDHSAHAGLAERFFQSMEAVLVYDFEVIDTARLTTSAAPREPDRPSRQPGP